MAYSDQNEIDAIGGAVFSGNDVFASENNWRTPGVISSSEPSIKDPFPKISEKYGIGDVLRAIGRTTTQDVLNEVPGAVGAIAKTGVNATGIPTLFVRGAFILLGTIFIGVALVMLSRPAREGIVEGVQDAVRESV